MFHVWNIYLQLGHCRDECKHISQQHGTLNSFKKRRQICCISHHRHPHPIAKDLPISGTKLRAAGGMYGTEFDWDDQDSRCVIFNGLTYGKICRKPLIFPWNMGVSCNFSLKPTNWDMGAGLPNSVWGLTWFKEAHIRKQLLLFFSYQWEMEWFKDGNGYFVSVLIKDPVKMLSLDVYRRACSAGLGYWTNDRRINLMDLDGRFGILVGFHDKWSQEK